MGLLLVGIGHIFEGMTPSDRVFMITMCVEWSTDRRFAGVTKHQYPLLLDARAAPSVLSGSYLLEGGQVG